MGYLWHELRERDPADRAAANPYILSLAWVTIRVAVISTAIALVIGLPIGLALGLGRFRGPARAAASWPTRASRCRRWSSASFVLLLLLPQGAFGSLHIAFTLRGVYVAQTILALPYIVALTPAAIQGLPPGLLAQARALGAGRVQLSLLALREAKIGVLAAVIAAFGAALSEVGAVMIVGGNIQNYDQTLASAIARSRSTTTPTTRTRSAIGIVLLALILVLIGILTVLQQRTSGIQLRFRTV